MHIGASSTELNRRTGALANYLQHSGGRTASSAQAHAMAQGSLYQQLIRQSTQLAYLDVIALLAIGAACMIPLIFLMKKRKVSGPVSAH